MTTIRKELTQQLARAAEEAAAQPRATAHTIAADMTVAGLGFLADRIEALERQAQENRGLSYAGAWESGRSYSKGECTTYGGSLWHANAATASRPGHDGSWTLAVKRGRDGKDAA